MAKPRDLVVRFVSDVRGFLKGTDQVEAALTETERDLKHLTGVGDREATELGRAYGRAADKISRETTGAVRGVRGKLKLLGADAGSEFAQNIGEGISSGKTGVAGAIDTLLGTAGGFLPALGPAGAVAGVGALVVGTIVSSINAGQERMKQAGRDTFDAFRDGVLDATERQDLLNSALGTDNLSDSIDKVNDLAGKLNIDKVRLLHALLYPDDPDAGIVDTLRKAKDGTDGINTATEEGRQAYLRQRNAAQEVLDIMVQQNGTLDETLSKVAQINAAAAKFSWGTSPYAPGGSTYRSQVPRYAGGGRS